MTPQTSSGALLAALLCLVAGRVFIRVYDRGFANMLMEAGLVLVRHGQRLQARRELKAAEAREEFRRMQEQPGRLVRAEREARYTREAKVQ